MSNIHPIKKSEGIGVEGAMGRADEQSTVRVRKELQEKLRMICAIESMQGERVTMLSLVDRVLEEFVTQFETVYGRRLVPAPKDIPTRKESD
jgi:hypothetical protein